MRVKRQLWLVAVAAFLTVAGWPRLTQRTIRAADPATGPQTEKRFPPLKVPKGFNATFQVNGAPWEGKAPTATGLGEIICKNENGSMRKSVKKNLIRQLFDNEKTKTTFENPLVIGWIDEPILDTQLIGYRSQDIVEKGLVLVIIRVDRK